MRGILVQLNIFERPHSQPQQRQNGKGERETSYAQACSEGKVEARKAQLIHEIRDHIDLAAANQLWRSESAERPGKSVAYCLDTQFTERSIELADRCTALIHETTFGPDAIDMARDRNISISSLKSRAFRVREKVRNSRISVALYCGLRR